MSILHLCVFFCCFFSLLLCGKKAGFKPYMCISPTMERMRKRKAFADTELEVNAPPTSASHLFVTSVPSSTSSVSNLTPSYARRPMLPLPQHGHSSNMIDYHALHQTTIITNENDATKYLATPTTEPLCGYQFPELPHSKSPSSMSSLSLSPLSLPSPQPLHKIRIIDDAKLVHMRRQIHVPSPAYCEPLTTAEYNGEYTINAKPKLSFSIESIIGIE